MSNAEEEAGVIDQFCCEAIAVLIKEQTAALAVKALWTLLIQLFMQPESPLIDKDSAAEWFSHMLTQAGMLFHMMQPH